MIKVNRDEFDLIFLNYVMFEYYLRNMIWYVLLIVLNVVKMEFVRILFLKSIFYNKWVLKGFNLENICMFILRIFVVNVLNYKIIKLYVLILLKYCL